MANNSRAQDHKVLLFDMEVDSTAAETCVGNSRITSAHDCGFFMFFFDDLKCAVLHHYLLLAEEGGLQQGEQNPILAKLEFVLFSQMSFCNDLKTRK